MFSRASAASDYILKVQLLKKESENGEEKNDLMMCHYDVREERRRICEREEEEGGAFVVHG